MSKIILNMIVKNEAKIIKRCLDSVWGMVHEIVIVDTGSTDGTPEVIAEWGKENEYYPHIRYCKFENFSQARNEALKRVKELCDPDDYILFLDAGMVLEKKYYVSFDLVEDHYTFEHKFPNSDTTWRNTRLVKAKHALKWVGACHEYLETSASPVFSDQLMITCNQDGGNQTGQASRYLRMLLEDFPKLKGYEKVRTQFYIAQTYFDLEDYGEAINWYIFSNSAPISDEERFYAKYRYAFCLWVLGEPIELIEENFLFAWQRRPWRIEPIYELVRMLKINCPNQKKKIEAYQRVIDNTPLPEDDVLFVEKEKYNAK